MSLFNRAYEVLLFRNTLHTCTKLLCDKSECNTLSSFTEREISSLIILISDGSYLCTCFIFMWRN